MKNNSVQRNNQLPPVKKEKRRQNGLGRFNVIRSLKDLETDEDLEQELYDNFPDEEEYSKY